jgi:hypothetical protein
MATIIAMGVAVFSKRSFIKGFPYFRGLVLRDELS